MHYADASALVKLAVVEPESAALHAWLTSGGIELATSDLTRTELVRAVRRVAPTAMVQAKDLIARMLMLRASPSIFDDAGHLEPVGLRSLDAVHLASALLLGDELESIVTYDDRMAEAAALQGIPVSAPR